MKCFVKKIRLIPVPPKEPKRLRVAAYCRVSTRSKEQQASLFRQIWAYMNQILNSLKVQNEKIGLRRNSGNLPESFMILEKADRGKEGVQGWKRC